MKRFQLADQYRQKFPVIPMWIWTKGNGSSRSYLDKFFIRISYNDIAKSPQSTYINYSDHEIVICMFDIYKEI